MERVDAAELLPRAAFGLAQNGSDTLACKNGALGQSLGVTAVTVILGVITQTGLDAVRCSVRLPEDRLIFDRAHIQLDPGRRMVARMRLPADPAIHSGIVQARRQFCVEQ
jgi:hypothetical protein